MSKTVAEKQHKLINALMDKNGIKNYAQLSRKLGVAPPVVSKTINGELAIGSNMLLRLHEHLGANVAEMRAALAED